jgi:hypothetical protein
MAHVLATFGQFERRLISQRTKEALAVKKASEPSSAGSGRGRRVRCRRGWRLRPAPSADTSALVWRAARAGRARLIGRRAGRGRCSRRACAGWESDRCHRSRRRSCKRGPSRSRGRSARAARSDGRRRVAAARPRNL